MRTSLLEVALFLSTLASVILIPAIPVASAQEIFAMSADPVSLTFPAGSSGTSTITLTNEVLSEFRGVLLSPSTPGNGPTASLSPTQVDLTAGGGGASTLTISSSPSTPRGLYTVNVTATIGSVSKLLSITVAVTPISITVNSVNTFPSSGEYTVTTTAGLAVDSPSSSLTLSGTGSVVATNSSTGATLFSKTYKINAVSLNEQISAPSLTPTGGFSARLVLNIGVTPYPLSSDIAVSISQSASSSASVQVTRNVDMDADGIVNQGDLSILLNSYGCVKGNPCYDPLADLDADGRVDILDASIFGAYFGAVDFLPNFEISASPASLMLELGTSGTPTLTLTSINGFAGNVMLSTSTSPSGPTASLNATSVTLPLDGMVSSTITLTPLSPSPFTVNVTAASGALSHSFMITVSLVSTLGAPQDLQASASDASVHLKWAAPASTGSPVITNYRIYRGQASGNLTLLAQVGNVENYTDRGLTNGVTYSYQVSAKNAVMEGPRSMQVVATPASSQAPPLPPAQNPILAFVKSNLAWLAPAAIVVGFVAAVVATREKGPKKT